MVKRPKNAPKRHDPAGPEDAQRPLDHSRLGRLLTVVNAYESRAAAGLAAGVTANQLGRYLRGGQEPSFQVMANLAAGKGFSLDWLWSGIGSPRIGEDHPDETPDPTLVAVPVMDVRAGAGAEQYALDEAPISSLVLPRAYLLANGIKPAFAKLVFCIGDSMEPTILDGAPMVVDTSDIGERDDVYVMRRTNGVIVKRLQHLADGTVLLKSDNPAYEADRLPRDDADELRALGRVGLVLQSI